MNILFLSEVFHPHGGGAAFATYLYAKLLAEKEFDIAVVTSRFAGEPEVSKKKNLVIYRLPLLKRNGSVKYSVLQRPDILFSNFMKRQMKWADVVYIPRFWYSGVVFAKAYGKPVVVHVHDYIPVCPLAQLYDVSKSEICSHNSGFCPPSCIYSSERTHSKGLARTITSIALNSIFGCYFGKVVRLSDAIICVSKAQRNLIVKADPSFNSKTRVIYNPLPKISPVDIEGDDFGYFGGPSHLKGFRVLYNAVVYVNRFLNDKPLKIHATKFTTVNRHSKESLNHLGFFTYAKLSNSEYKKLYGQLRAVVVPSVWAEPLPYVVFEAILRGRLVVASHIGGIPEQVEGCKGAFLFDAGNHSQLAKTMENVSGLSRENVIDLCSNDKEVLLKRQKNEIVLRDFAKVLENNM